MSRVLFAKEIAAYALAAIGSYPVTDSGPQPADLSRATSFLDMLLAELVTTERVFKRITAETLSIDVVNGTQDYDIYAELGSDLPDDGIEYVVDAYLEDGHANRTRLEIVTRERFENVSLLSTTGPPCWAFVDRSDESAPQLRIFPTPSTTDSNTYTIKLICQRFAPDVAPSGVVGTIPQDAILTGMGQGWNRFLTFQLAHDLGSGPIKKIGEQSLTRFAAMAAESKRRLLAFTNREHDTSDPVGEPWGLS